jgi:hypothetical protein
MNRRLDVVILEKRSSADGECDAACTRGCNFCVGVISPKLNAILEQHGLTIPDEVIQASFDYVWIQGQWKNFRLRVPAGMRMNAVYRGSLPSSRDERLSGFDAFLLSEARKAGARIERGKVEAVEPAPSGLLGLTVVSPSGERSPYEAAFVALATGINAEGSDKSLLASMKRMSPSFAPGRARKALIFEIEVGEAFIQRHFHREVYYIEYGSKALRIEHAALVPKGRFLTVAIIGKCVDDAVLPRDNRAIAHAFLALPQIHRILPGIQTAPFACGCAPCLPVTTAKSPFGHRFALIGDAVGARLYKDGLFSAHATALGLAETVLHRGVDERALTHGYGKVVRQLAVDNRYGRIVFALSRVAFARRGLGRITYQAFATEYKVRDRNSRPLTAVLWKIASGTAHYRDVLKEMCSVGVLWSFVVGALITLRNVVVEGVLGLRWGEYGRYPTVVLKEKREVLKKHLASSLGLPLDRTADFERMYAIKIRSAPEAILEALGKFGQDDARFLKLRFSEVRRIAGTANQVGSVVRYRFRMLPLHTELRLTTRIASETLLYEGDERCATGGKLVFDVALRKDGNCRLVIYASFDYKRGSGWLGRALWRLFRALFPEFVHDIVWNHAMCTIKEEVERVSQRGGAGCGCAQNPLMHS